MAKIYVASSWRNQYYPDVVKQLREFGHEVYDFRNPPHNHGAFMWKNIDPEFETWSVEQYKKGLEHPSSERQFQADLDALNWADTCILVLPCGRSAHTEAGWMKGAGKKVIVYIPEMQEKQIELANNPAQFHDEKKTPAFKGRGNHQIEPAWAVLERRATVTGTVSWRGRPGWAMRSSSIRMELMARASTS